MDGIEDPWNYAISSFNPYQCDLTPLEVCNFFMGSTVTIFGH